MPSQKEIENTAGIAELLTQINNVSYTMKREDIFELSFLTEEYTSNIILDESAYISSPSWEKVFS